MLPIIGRRFCHEYIAESFCVSSLDTAIFRLPVIPFIAPRRDRLF